MLCVISTVGRSVFNNADPATRKRVDEFGKRQDIDLTDIQNKPRNFPGQELYDLLMSSLEAKKGSIELVREASAELNSLEHILTSQSVNNNDRLDFIASATPDGVLAARLVADFCMDFFARETKIHLIEGLQVRDGEQFRRLGLRSLISSIYQILKETPGGTFTRIINPTGGFKGVVPYLTIIGMLEGDIEMDYIYEQSPELIRLAGLPLRLDFERIESAFEALARCADDMIPEEELQKMLGIVNQPITAHPFWSLFDLVDSQGPAYYTLSGLGYIVYEHFKNMRRKTKIYLSRQAAQRFDALDSTQKRNLGKVLDQMTDLDWRRLQEHATRTGGDKILKATANERLAYFEDTDGTVLIAEITMHSDKSYEHLPELRRKDYAQYRLWEGLNR